MASFRNAILPSSIVSLPDHVAFTEEPLVKRLKPINKKAARIEALCDEADVVALQGGPPSSSPRRQGPHIPLGCSFAFAPGWEVDSSGGTAGLWQPVERDLFDCYLSCFWPAHVADHLNHAPDWTKKCGSAQKDWRKLDLVFP